MLPETAQHLFQQTACFPSLQMRKRMMRPRSRGEYYDPRELRRERTRLNKIPLRSLQNQLHPSSPNNVVHLWPRYFGSSTYRCPSVIPSRRESRNNSVLCLTCSSRSMPLAVFSCQFSKDECNMSSASSRRQVTVAKTLALLQSLFPLHKKSFPCSCTESSCRARPPASSSPVHQYRGSISELFHRTKRGGSALFLSSLPFPSSSFPKDPLNHHEGRRDDSMALSCGFHAFLDVFSRPR